jgi:hypothetical protein
VAGRECDYDGRWSYWIGAWYIWIFLAPTQEGSPAPAKIRGEVIGSDNCILTFNLTPVNQHGLASIEPSVIRISSTCMAEESQERACREEASGLFNRLRRRRKAASTDQKKQIQKTFDGEKMFRLLIGRGPGHSTDGSEKTYIPTNIPSHHRFINREDYRCTSWMFALTSQPAKQLVARPRLHTPWVRPHSTDELPQGNVQLLNRDAVQQ